jgi:hypothetical protein
MKSGRILVGALFTASIAHAEGTKVRLEVQADPGCVTSESLATAVRGLLERDAFDESSTAVIRVEIASHGSSFEAKLTLEARGRVVGTREIVREGASCAVIEGPLAVVTALLIDVAEASIRIVVPPPPPPPPPPPARPVTRLPPKSPRFTLANEIAPSLLVGLFPTVTPGLRIGLELGRGLFAFATRFEFFPSSNTVVNALGGEFRAAWASSGPCFQPGTAYVRVHMCVLGSFGAALAHATNVRVSSSSVAPLVLVEPEIGARLRIVDFLWLVGSASLATGLQPTEWYIARGPADIVIHRPWAFSVVVSSGARVEF